MQRIHWSRWVGLISVLWLAACSPDQNWRDVALDGTAFKVQLPCKPDRTTRAVNMGALALSLQVVGCESAGAIWAVMTTELPPGADAPGLMAGWQKATLQNARVDASVTPPHQQVWHRPDWLPLAQTLRIQAKGQDAKGQEVMLDAVWGAVTAGDRVRLIHAVVYAPQISPEMANILFDGLRP
jgi:hypothetical protein